MKRLLILVAMVGGLATVAASESQAGGRVRVYSGYNRPYYGNSYGGYYGSYRPSYGYRSGYRSGYGNNWGGYNNYNRGWNNRGWGGGRSGFSIRW